MTQEKTKNVWYKPPNANMDAKVQDATLAVKFSKNIVLLESFLKIRNIEYDPDELEDTPMGKGIIIRRD